jgi:homogentisate phytyltransferase/homogentisate geranylgeranyltransferase
VLWRFARPHTIVGTTVSIVALYVIARAGGAPSAGALDLAGTLVAGWTVNVFIVGINQLEDVEIDRINKPELPIAAGELSPAAGWWIVGACAVIPLALALTQGTRETAAVAAALGVGWAYSCPPLRLKRYALVAAAAIAVVRTLVVNLGVWLHFSPGGVAPVVWALTAFTLPYSVAIAILKDVPDVEGDRRYGIATFSVRLGARTVLGMALGALTIAEIGMAVAAPLLLDGAGAALMAAGQLAAGALLWWRASRLDLADRAAITSYYQLVWRLFFWEYALVAGAVVLAA